MGAEDMRRQAAERRAHGPARRGGTPVEFGTRTLKEATSEAIRDWITNVETTHYLIGSCVGPAPYPEIVRDLQRVIGDEAREQILAAEGRLPDAVVACVGGGSNAIGAFYGFLDDADVRSSASRPPAPRASEAAAPASCTARALRCSPTRTGRSPTRTRSPPASTTPASAPSTRAFATRPRRVPRRAPTRRRSPPSTRSRGPRGSSPRSSASHALARALDIEDELILVCLSGRGDKDLAEVLAPHDALVIYLVSEPETPELARAAVEGGADIVELGFPFSDPLADGPTIRRAVRARARARDAHAAVPRVLARRARLVDIRSSR